MVVGIFYHLPCIHRSGIAQVVVVVVIDLRESTLACGATHADQTNNWHQKSQAVPVQAHAAPARKRRHPQSAICVKKNRNCPAQAVTAVQAMHGPCSDRGAAPAGRLSHDTQRWYHLASRKTPREISALLPRGSMYVCC